MCGCMGVCFSDLTVYLFLKIAPDLCLNNERNDNSTVAFPVPGITACLVDVTNLHSSPARGMICP